MAENSIVCRVIEQSRITSFICSAKYSSNILQHIRDVDDISVITALEAGLLHFSHVALKYLFTAFYKRFWCSMVNCCLKLRFRLEIKRKKLTADFSVKTCYISPLDHQKWTIFTSGFALVKTSLFVPTPWDVSWFYFKMTIIHYIIFGRDICCLMWHHFFLDTSLSQ